MSTVMRSSRVALHLVVTAASLLVVSSPALALDLRITGYLKSFSSVLDPPLLLDDPIEVDLPLLGRATHRLRLTTALRITRNLSLSYANDLGAEVQDRLLFLGEELPLPINQRTYRLTDPPRRLYPETLSDLSSFGATHNIDRLNLFWRLPRFDITVGRQPIAWGAARVVNPTDIFAPFTYTDLDTEDRVGVDAIRVSVPIDIYSSIDFGWVTGEDLDDETSGFFARVRTFAVGLDWSATAIRFRNNFLLGADVAGSLAGLGWWTEFAVVDPEAFLEGTEVDDYTRLSVGVDVAPFPNSYAFLEYHYNGPGTTRASEYLGRLTDIAYSEGTVYLLGKNYLAPGFVWQPQPLWSVTMGALTNLDDPSILVAPSAEVNVAPDVYLSVGAYVGFGSKPNPRVDFLAGDLRVAQSEFGTYPDIFFGSFRYYF